MNSTSGASIPFVKNLASSDRTTRMRALESLRSFLATKYGSQAPPTGAAPLTFSDAHKLWAGLFYALWMADRAPAQQRLCTALADLPRDAGLPDAAVAAWLRAFWATMAGQWTTGIDVLRMDKFLLLVRRVLKAQLAWMAGITAEGVKASESVPQVPPRRIPAPQAEALGLAVLAAYPLNVEGEVAIEDDEEESEEDDDVVATRGRPRNTSKTVVPTIHIPVGLTLHAVDIWVDELVTLGLLVEDQTASGQRHARGGTEPESLARRVHTLVEALVAGTRAPAVRKRALEALADERLPWNDHLGPIVGSVNGGGGGLELQGGEGNDDDDEDDDKSWDGFN